MVDPGASWDEAREVSTNELREGAISSALAVAAAFSEAEIGSEAITAVVAAASGSRAEVSMGISDDMAGGLETAAAGGAIAVLGAADSGADKVSGKMEDAATTAGGVTSATGGSEITLEKTAADSVEMVACKCKPCFSIL